MLRSRRIPQAKHDCTESIAGVKIPRESHVPQVVLPELSVLPPCALRNVRGSARGQCAARDGSDLRAWSQLSAGPTGPILRKRKRINLGAI